jgi:hypothetical protein
MRPARGPIALTWALWAVMLAGTAVLVWLELELHRAGRPDLALQPEELPYPAAALIAATMGGLLVTRRPRHPVGWLLTAFGLLIVVLGIADDYARFGLVARPGSLPAVGLVAILGDVFMFLPVVIGFVLLLTPTGTLPPGRGWRWWAWVTVTASVVHQIGRLLSSPSYGTQHYTVVNPLFIPDLEPPEDMFLLLLLLIFLGPLVGAASLVVRLRRARGVQPQQLRLVTGAATLAVVAVPLAVLGVSLDSPLLVGVALLGYATVVCAAITAAVLRDRLYDLDHLLSRTLSYGLLTGVLAGLYAFGVLVAGHVVSPGGRAGSLVVAATTLAVAAAFSPLRRRIQRQVDRRFNRRRYDAARTIDAFAARLRDETDLGVLRTELLAVVDGVMQPSGVSLWLRPGGRRL